jgi:hypothetical protein
MINRRTVLERFVTRRCPSLRDDERDMLLG